MSGAAQAARQATSLSDELIAEHGISPDEYARLLEELGREPSLTELGIFSVMWSEHCSYKSSRRVAQEASDHRPASDPRPGRECGRGRSRRRPGRRLQDGEPQPPVLHRALSGGRDRRRRHHARRVHHGRAACRQHECAALRRAGPCKDAASRGRRRLRHRRLRQLHGRADRGRRDQFRCPLQRQHPGQRHDRGPRRCEPHLHVRGERRRAARGLCGLQDRPRRHSRRHHGVGGVRRGVARRSAPRCRWAIPSPRSCCSKRVSS